MLVSSSHSHTFQLIEPCAGGISLPTCKSGCLSSCGARASIPRLGRDKHLLVVGTPGPPTVVHAAASQAAPCSSNRSPRAPSSSQLGITLQTEAVQPGPASVSTVPGCGCPKQELSEAQIQRLGVFDAGTRGLHGDNHMASLGPGTPRWGQPRALQRVTVKQGRQPQARISRF